MISQRLASLLAPYLPTVTGRVLDPTGGASGVPAGDRPPVHLDELPAVVTRREAVLAVPTVRLRSTSPLPSDEASSWPSCEAVVGSVVLSRGAGRVFGALHAVACDVGRARAYAVSPGAVVFHLPASLLALAVGYTDRHLRRLLPELEAAGLVACGAHAGLVNDMRLWDGYLWAVKTSTGEIAPTLRREDWRHQWRDFAGDMQAGRTVKALLEQMSALQTEQKESAVKAALDGWAVTPGNLSNPRCCTPDIGGTDGLDAVQDVRQVAYRLGELVAVLPLKRAELVGRFGSALARCLDDAQSRRWYCLLLWQALRAEQEGRGGLGALAAALVRLEADRAEWAELRNPAALLASRLRSVA